MTLSSKLTIFVPIKNRSIFLSKMLNYYSRVNCSSVILLGDASEPAEYDENTRIVKKYCDRLSIVHFQQLSHLTHNQAAIEMLKKVKTPYCSWAGDDDFLVPHHIEKCISFLDQHPDFSVACGEKIALYLERCGDHFKLLHSVPIGHRHIDNPSASHRMIQLVFPFWAINTYSIEKTENMRRIWNRGFEMGLMENKDYNHLFEIYFNLANVVCGKQAFIPGLARVVCRHSIKSHSSKGGEFFDMLLAWNWPERVRRVVEILSEQLMNAEGLDSQEARNVVIGVLSHDFGSFLERCQNSAWKKAKRMPPINYFQRIFARLAVADIYAPGKFLTRIYKSDNRKTALKALMHKRSPHYKDFMPVYQVLKESNA